MRFRDICHGNAFKEKYCYKCRNWKDSVGKIAGCPIWDVHVLYHNSDHRGCSDILDILIDGTMVECSMFDKLELEK